MEEDSFGFEKLEVWKKAITFAVDVIDLCEKIETGRKHYRLLEQVEASSTSVAANISEGKGRYSKKEFVQFLYIARGSLFETITFLVIFRQKQWISETDLKKIKNDALEIGKMVSSLINKIKKDF